MITEEQEKNNKKEFNEGGNPPLGNKAKSATTSIAQTLAIQGIRAKRYELLAVSRDILNDAGIKKNLKYAMDYHRTAKCKFVVHGSAVGVLKSKTYNRAFYNGLQTCGSVWTCPVCASKIQEKRRGEVAKAVDYFYSNNYQAVLITFTFSHKRTDILELLLKQFADALKKLRKGKQWDNFKKRVDFKGLIRSLEVTHSENNGFHPHTHELWFLDKNVNQKEFIAFVQKRWLSACKRAGLFKDGDNLKNFLKRSIDVKFNCRASDYLNKQDSSFHWGVDREIAKGASKKGKHPFYFLEENTPRTRQLFLEFADAIKGKSQLFWSRGLKNLVGINDKTDEELAEEETDNADNLGLLTLTQWHIIRTLNIRAQVLDIAENENFEAVIKFINENDIMFKQNPH